MQEIIRDSMSLINIKLNLFKIDCKYRMTGSGGGGNKIRPIIKEIIFTDNELIMFKIIPFRIIIYLLEYHEYKIDYYEKRNSVGLFYGYFKLDRFRKSFLIFQSIFVPTILYKYKIPLKIINISIGLDFNEYITPRYIVCNRLTNYKNINNLYLIYDNRFIFNENNKYSNNRVKIIHLYMYHIMTVNYLLLKNIDLCCDKLIVHTIDPYLNLYEYDTFVKEVKQYNSKIKIEYNTTTYLD